jgi:6-phosphofructokinase 2
VGSAIATVTVNPAVDQVALVDDVAPGRKIRAREAVFEPGGGGVNVSRGLQRLGREARALWSRAGETGTLLGNLLDERGLANRPIDVRGRTRVNTIAVDEADGPLAEYLFGMPGPTFGDPERARWQAAIESLDVDCLVLSGSPPRAGGWLYPDLVRGLGDGTDVVLDTSGPALSRTLDAGVTLVKPNRGELSALAGRSLETPSAIEAVARDLVQAGSAEIVVASLGAKGAIAVDEARSVRARAPEVRQRSHIGAGDSMVAGLVDASQETASLEALLRRGVAAGADAVRGSARELCTSEGTRELADEVLVRPGPA